jgi:hypothetical protein
LIENNQGQGRDPSSRDQRSYFDWE